MIRIILFLLSISFFSCENGTPTELGSRVEHLPYYDEATFTPHWFENDSDSLTSFHRIPEFDLVNQNGDAVSETTFDKHIYVTDFFFTTCPGICPKMTANMSILQEEFLTDNEVLLLSHSVTPTRDTVEQLKRYAENKGVNSEKWHLVTGERAVIYNLGRYQYFVEEDLGLEADPDEFLHTENFVLVDKQRHIRGIYNGLNKSSIKQLITDIKTLKLEG
ncbi:MAG: protein SCO1/2 [Saprospiraceae bacterium]|jgi:protein SCO1/2